LSWIKTVDEKEADGKLAEIYSQTTEKFGHVINLVKVQSLSPETIDISKKLYRHLMDKPGDLSKFHRVLLATVVSRLNNCFY